MTEPASERASYFPYLDGLRAVAVSLVLLAHFGEMDFHLEIISRLGPLGVDIFFVLSGFLITRLLLIEKGRTGRISFSKFYQRRFLRLGPALLGLFLVYGILIKLHLLLDLSTSTFLYSLLYLRNIRGSGSPTGHLWSLSLEEQFYLFWPAVLWLANLKKTVKIAAFTIVAIATVRTVSILVHPDLAFTPKPEWRPWFRMDAILLGSLYAIAVLKKSRWLVVLEENLGKIPAGFLWAAVLAWTLFIPRQESIYITFRVLFAALLFVQLMAQKEGVYGRLLSYSLFVLVGRLSYSLYLWQQIFLYVKTPSWGVLRAFPFDLIMTFACALFSYFVIEKPFLRIKARIHPIEIDTQTAARDMAGAEAAS